MIVSLPAVLLALAAGASALSRASPPCSVPDDGDAPSQLVERRSSSPLQKRAPIDLDVNFHIASSEDQDIVTDAMIDAQWEVLHDAFAVHNINLRFNTTTRTVDNLTGHNFLVYEGPDLGWVNHVEEKNAFFSSTRLGGYDALNMYIFSPNAPGLSGYCTWPTVLPADDGGLTFGLDGCQVSANTMPLFPGGNDEYNLGLTAVHEAGHWFGLNHTFAGGCSEPGDFVADTPAHGMVYGCPVGSDTCPGVPGLDPIHNYMGYTDDNCRTEFTPGQEARMFDVFSAYRSGK